MCWIFLIKQNCTTPLNVVKLLRDILKFKFKDRQFPTNISVNQTFSTKQIKTFL